MSAFASTRLVDTTKFCLTPKEAIILADLVNEGDRYHALYNNCRSERSEDSSALYSQMGSIKELQKGMVEYKNLNAAQSETNLKLNGELLKTRIKVRQKGILIKVAGVAGLVVGVLMGLIMAK